MKRLPIAAALLVWACGPALAQFEGVDAAATIVEMKQAKIGKHAAPAAPKSPFSAKIRAKYDVRGIDVSHYQHAIDWKKVGAQKDISFAYIKATDGDTVVDERFAQNWKGAGSIGISRGAYHFYNFCRDAADQADNFIANVPVDPRALPPAVDLEHSLECRGSKMPDRAAFRKEFDVFVTKIVAAYHKGPLIYVQNKIYDKYFSGDPGTLLLWVPSPDEPAFTDQHPWLFWQYSAKGRVAGISEDVDLDVFSGEPFDLAALAAKPIDFAMK